MSPHHGQFQRGHLWLPAPGACGWLALAPKFGVPRRRSGVLKPPSLQALRNEITQPNRHAALFLTRSLYVLAGCKPSELSATLQATSASRSVFQATSASRSVWVIRMSEYTDQSVRATTGSAAIFQD